MGIIWIFIALFLFFPGVKAPLGSEYDVIAPIEFNTETPAPPIVWEGTGSPGVPPKEKPEPPVLIQRVSMDDVRAWIWDAALPIIFGVGIVFLILMVILWRQNRGVKSILRRTRRRTPEIEV